MITRLPIAAGGKRNDDGFLSVSGDCCGGDDMQQVNDAGKIIIGSVSKEEIARAEATVRENILMNYVKPTNNQFSALVSFALSVTPYDFSRSKLVKLVNINTKESLLAASKEFEQWVMQGKRVSKALQKRREKEKSLFLKPEVVVNNMKEKT